MAVCFIAAIVGLAGLTWLALALPHPKLSSSPISMHDFVGVLQLGPSHDQALTAPASVRPPVTVAGHRTAGTVRPAHPGAR
jgi:hypothetical protein